MTETPEQSSWGEYVAGILVGAVIGAAASLLYAPKSGKETREELLARLDDLKDRVDATAKEVAELTKAKLDETKADLSEAMQAGRSAVKARTKELRQQAGLE